MFVGKLHLNYTRLQRFCFTHRTYDDNIRLKVMVIITKIFLLYTGTKKLHSHVHVTGRSLDAFFLNIYPFHIYSGIMVKIIYIHSKYYKYCVIKFLNRCHKML